MHRCKFAGHDVGRGHIACSNGSENNALIQTQKSARKPRLKDAKSLRRWKRRDRRHQRGYYAVKTTSTTSTSTTSSTCACDFPALLLQADGQLPNDESETNISFIVTVPECCCVTGGGAKLVLSLTQTSFTAPPATLPPPPVLSSRGGAQLVS